MTPYEIFQLERYGNILEPETEVEEQTREDRRMIEYLEAREIKEHQ